MFVNTKKLSNFGDSIVAVNFDPPRVDLALWHRSLKEQIEAQLDCGEIPRLQEWMTSQKPIQVDFNADAYDPFFNINTPQDLYAAEPMSTLVK